MTKRERYEQALLEDMLRSECPDARRLAAKKLGEMWAIDALKKIERALRRKR